MYKLPAKLVLVNATSGISDLYFLDFSLDKDVYVKPLDKTISNSSLSILERYFPQKSEVLVFSDKEDKNLYLKRSENQRRYFIGTPIEENSSKLLSKMSSDDLIYLDMDFEKLKVIRVCRGDKNKKVEISSFEENYSERLSKLIKESEEILANNPSFREMVNDFSNAREYGMKYRQSSYILASLLRTIFSSSKFQKDLDFKSFAKSSKTNPVLVIGGNVSKFFSVDLLLLSFSQAQLEPMGFEIYSDYSHLMLAYLSNSEKDLILSSLLDKCLETIYIGKYINLMSNSSLQKLYCSIKIKDGLATKDLFGITGTYLKYEFIETGSAKFEILADEKKQKIIKSLEFDSLRKNLFINFINPKQNIENRVSIKDFLNYINWENNILN